MNLSKNKIKWNKNIKESKMKKMNIKKIKM